MKPLLRIFFWALLFFPLATAAQLRYASHGVLDLRAIDLSTETIPLRGEWAFFGASLLPAGQFPNTEYQPDFIRFPGTWNDRNENQTPGNGYATYWLRVFLTRSGTMALELPHFYSSYTLWINQKQVASNGVVGTSRAKSVPQWLPQTIAFTADTDTIDIVIHVSNFHHALGGIREDILLGTADNLMFKRRVATTSYLVMGMVLLLIAVTALVVHLFGKKDTGFLYLFLLALTWAIRSMFSNLYIAHNYIPNIPWEVAVKIEYVTLYLMMIWAILLLSSLFRGEVSAVFKILFTAANVIFTFLTLLFDAMIYTQFLPVYLTTAGLILLYTLYVLVRAIMSDLNGVWLMVSCLFLAVIIFAYDIVSYEGFATFNPIIINAGYVVIFVLLSLSLMYQPGAILKRRKSGNILRYEDLYQEENEKVT